MIKKVHEKNFKTLSIPSFKIKADNFVHEYALLGGMLYVDGEPVQHYFSKDMFYYETKEEQCSIFLRHHGLMADVKVCKDGVMRELKAGSELHYTIKYTSNTNTEHVLDAAFGMGIDKNRKSYYYCGLKFNDKIIIPIPQEEEACKEQGIMSISAEEITGNLVAKWNMQAYIGAKDENGNIICSDFKIADMTMTFDALYNTCDVEITEGEYNVKSYEAIQFTHNFVSTENDTLKGECEIIYEDSNKVKKSIVLYGIDAVKVSEGKYVPFCGIRYNGQEVLTVPTDETKKKNQNFLQVIFSEKSWIVAIREKELMPFLEEIRSKDNTFYIRAVTILGKYASVVENMSVIGSYKAKGSIKINEVLLAKRKNFAMNAEIMARLKCKCLETGMNEPPLTLELLASIEPPTMTVEVEERGEKKKITMDGQQYCGYLTSSILTDLVNYYTGQTTNSEDNLKFEDIFGKNKAACYESIQGIHKNLLFEIENAEDSENGKKKGYLVDFLKTLAPIMLTSSLAERTNKEIVEGYGGSDKEKKALAKSRFYLTYSLESEKEEYDVLSASPEYHQIIAIIDKYVYLSVTDKLKAFMEDKTTSYEEQGNLTAQQYWAKRLYYHCVETINMLHMTYEVNPAKVTHLVKLLGILDSESYDIKDSWNGKVLKDENGNSFHSSYALALYGQLCNYTIKTLVDSYKGEEDYKNYCKMLQDLFGKFYDKVKNGKIKLPAELEELYTKIMTEDKEIFLEWSIFQADTLMQLMISSGDMSSALLKYNPSNFGFTKFFSCVNLLMGMAAFANIFMGWEELTSLQKAESILAVLSGAFAVGRNFLIWETVNTIFNQNATPVERINAYYRFQIGGGTLDNLDAVTFHDGDTFNFKDQVEESSKRYSLKLKESGTTRINFVKNAASTVFICVEIVFRLINVVFMGIVFVATCIELHKMFQHKSQYGDFILALSVINGILSAIALVLGVAELVLGFTSYANTALVTSWIPVINGIVMMVMFVCALLLLIFHKEPKSPITLLIQEQIKDKIEKLPEPKKGWIEENTPKNLLSFNVPALA